MKTAGMIVEYNPMHRGHLHLLEEVRRRLGADCGIIGVMSGDAVQRGEFALLRRQARSRAAVESGVDLLLELPAAWAVSSAERFADGGVQILLATGLATHLAFGSECGEGERLMALARALLSPAFPPLLREELTRGDSFASARQRAAGRLCGVEPASLLASPNNLLGVEYCKALLRRRGALEVLTVPRSGAPHDGEAEPSGAYASSSGIRRLLREGRRREAMEQMAPAMAAIYGEEEKAGRAPVFRENSERALLSRLRSMDPEDFAALDQGSEGLYRRLYEASRSARSLEEFLQGAKTKRYPYARLQRMSLWAYLGLTPKDWPERVPYLRVLACSETGRRLLGRMRKTAKLPLITKPARIPRLGEEAARVWAWETRTADLYALAYPDLTKAEGGALWREGPILLA